MAKSHGNTWYRYFVMVNYTTLLPCLKKATERRSHVLEYYHLSPAIERLLETLSLKILQETIPDKNACYALIARHVLVLHAQGNHEEEAAIYSQLETMDTSDWPMKCEASFNRIRCLREQVINESVQERKASLCEEILESVRRTETLLRNQHSDTEWNRSTVVRDEKDFLLLASMEAKCILDLPFSNDENGLLKRAERRRLNRKHRSPYIYGKFWHDHREALVKFWGYYRPIWYTERYREKYGREPEHEPIMRYPSGGWSIHPDYEEVDDHKRFLRDAENAYRQSKGLPLRGQGWDSETHLKLLVKQIASPLQVLFEHSPPWLYPQRYDIFLPEVNLAIEYMGEQHYWAIEHFGGEEGFKYRKNLDERKRSLSQTNGITVLDWRYDEDTNEQAVRRKLFSYLEHARAKLSTYVGQDIHVPNEKS